MLSTTTSVMSSCTAHVTPAPAPIQPLLLSSVFLIIQPLFWLLDYDGDFVPGPEPGGRPHVQVRHGEQGPLRQLSQDGRAPQVCLQRQLQTAPDFLDDRAETGGVLYVGGWDAAEDLEGLQAANITTVVNCTTDLGCPHRGK